MWRGSCLSRRRDTPEAFAALLDPAGNWSALKLGDLPVKKEFRDRLLRFATVVLPANIGGLKDGLLDDSERPVRDVVDTNLFQRVLLSRTSDGWKSHHLPRNESAVALGTYESVSAACKKLSRLLGSKTKLLAVSGPEDNSDDDLPPDLESARTLPLWRVAYFASQVG